MEKQERKEYSLRAEIRMFQRRIEEEKYDLLREVDLVEILSFRSDSI